MSDGGRNAQEASAAAPRYGVFPLDGLPAEVTVYDVGPRDGLQNEPGVVPVEVKAEFVRRLVAAGLRAVEVTSFVHPRWVPQLADAEQLLAELSDLTAAAAGEAAGGCGCRCSSPTSAAWTAPWPPGCGRSRCSAASRRALPGAT